METGLGTGQNFMRDFAVDFAADQVYIGGKTFPKGYFTVAVLNYGKELRTKLLFAGLPVRDALKQMKGRTFSPEVYDKAVAAVWEIHESLFYERLAFLEGLRLGMTLMTELVKAKALSVK